METHKKDTDKLQKCFAEINKSYESYYNLDLLHYKYEAKADTLIEKINKNYFTACKIIENNSINVADNDLSDALKKLLEIIKLHKGIMKGYQTQLDHVKRGMIQPY